MDATAMIADSMAAFCGPRMHFSSLNFRVVRLMERARFSWKVKERLSREVELTSTASKPATFFCSAGTTTSVVSESCFSEALVKESRKRFCDEVAFQKKDQEVSVIKAMLMTSVEDEAFISINSEKDRLAVLNEGHKITSAKVEEHGDISDDLPLAGKNMSTWLEKFDSLSKEVLAILARKGGHHYLLHVLRAVNTVLLEVQGYSRSLAVMDPRACYLHHVLTYGRGTAIMLSIIYMEVCRRLGVKMLGAAAGEDFLIWPAVEDMQAIFELSDGGKSWFSEVNGTAIQSEGLKSSIEDSIYGSTTCSNATLEFVSNRDIIGIALRNLKNLHWKRACRSCPGFTLMEPLRLLSQKKGQCVNHSEPAIGVLLRPQDLRLAFMSSERLMILKPHNWALRRDHGLLLYHSRRYGEAVQELSICMALAPTKDAEVLEHFIEKLHLMRVELSWNPLLPPSAPSKLS